MPPPVRVSTSSAPRRSGRPLGSQIGMSYDLYFWREEPGAKIDIDMFFDELDDTVEFPGIVSLPLETVKQAFQQEFPAVKDGGGSLDYEGDGSYFQVGFIFLDERTVSRTAVCCGYELLKRPESMQRLANVAASLGYRVYDPQKM